MGTRCRSQHSRRQWRCQEPGGSGSVSTVRILCGLDLPLLSIIDLSAIGGLYQYANPILLNRRHMDGADESQENLHLCHCPRSRRQNRWPCTISQYSNPASTLIASKSTTQPGTNGGVARETVQQWHRDHLPQYWQLALEEPLMHKHNRAMRQQRRYDRPANSVIDRTCRTLYLPTSCTEGMPSCTAFHPCDYRVTWYIELLIEARRPMLLILPI